MSQCESLGDHPFFHPDEMLDAVKMVLKLLSDRELADHFKIGQPILSKIRHRKQGVGSALLIRIHEETHLSIAELRKLMGDRRRTYRVGKWGNKNSSATRTYFSDDQCALAPLAMPSEAR
jgi:hypothetical protein